MNVIYLIITLLILIINNKNYETFNISSQILCQQNVTQDQCKQVHEYNKENIFYCTPPMDTRRGICVWNNTPRFLGTFQISDGTCNCIVTEPTKQRGECSAYIGGATKDDQD
mgnify:CR=1 FL=1|tara:strand:+ start:355 stop:690 length:336 start_codon:yes stop_codon:yes gene_type:complete